MGFITAIALSGLKVSEVRVANAANNIVNADSVDFKPKDVIAKSLGEGGVTVDVKDRPISQASLLPAVDITSELIDTQRAAQAYKASAAVIATDKELNEFLLEKISDDD